MNQPNSNTPPPPAAESSPAAAKEHDTLNRFAVGAAGVKEGRHQIVLSRQVPMVLTRAEALNLAAWLSVLADPAGTDFNELREAILQT